MIKLNIGAGDSTIPGYRAMDAKRGDSIFPLKDYGDGTVDIIRASHILEHYGHKEIYDVVIHWVEKLKSGGVLRIAVPDFQKCIEPYNRGEKSMLIGYVMGGQVDEYDYHKSIFDKESLMAVMTAAGLENLQAWKSEIQDCASLPISLNIEGTKPENWRGPKKKEVNRPKIAAVMSMPRLAFTDNMFSAMRALLPFGISLERGCGVFWGQMLTRMIEKHLHDGTEYIITVDYDTWFTPAHVRRLIKLMQGHPEADAILPLQTGREQVRPLIGLAGPEGATEFRVPVAMFKEPMTQVVTGHFGLTIFRAASFAKMKKPWIWAQPDEHGGWGPGRKDEDIFFWHQFKDAGLKAFLANDIYLGHLQIVCTFPGKPEDNWGPIHIGMHELENGSGPPAHCVPAEVA